MIPRLARYFAALAVIALPLRVAAAQSSTATIVADPTSLLWGRQLTEWFYDGEADSIFVRFDDEMQQGMSRDDLIKFRDQVAVQGGAETEVIHEDVTEKDGLYNYHREIHMANAGDLTIVVYWTVDKSRKIVGFFIKPKQA